MIQHQAIIWDFDNTLYHLDGDCEEIWHQGIARMAVARGLPYSFEEALVIARESFATHKTSTAIFIERHGLCAREVHHEIHRVMDETHITPCNITAAAFAARPDIRHAIVSHGSKSWVLRARDHLGLGPYIPDHAVFGLEDYGFEKKSISLRGLNMALDALNINPAEAVFAEDQADNLKLAHDRLGMTTALIHYGAKPDEIPSHVDICAAHPAELLVR